MPEGLGRVFKDGKVRDGVSVKVDVDLIGGTGNGDLVVLVSGRDFVGNASHCGHKLDVWIVRYDPERMDVHIQAGENTGRVLLHRNLVRSLERVGEMGIGEDAAWKIPRNVDGLKWVLLVQQGTGGPIAGAARLEATPF